MKEIVIASSNKHKVSEITQKIHSYFQKTYSLSDFPEIGDIKEDGNSVLENSFIKSRVTFGYTNIPSVADDTALEVDCLNGDPGLYTARYAGENVTYDDNMNKLNEIYQNSINTLHSMQESMVETTKDQPTSVVPLFCQRTSAIPLLLSQESDHSPVDEHRFACSSLNRYQ